MRESEASWVWRVLLVIESVCARLINQLNSQSINQSIKLCLTERSHRSVLYVSVCGCVWVCPAQLLIAISARLWQPQQAQQQQQHKRDSDSNNRNRNNKNNNNSCNNRDNNNDNKLSNKLSWRGQATRVASGAFNGLTHQVSTTNPTKSHKSFRLCATLGRFKGISTC